jgi:hypothetical protein
VIGVSPFKFRLRKLLPAGGLAVLVLLLAWVLSYFTGHGPGAGGGAVAGPSQAAAQSAAAPKDPIEVVIQEDQYLVAGRPMTLDQVLAAAGPARPGSAAVKIVSGSDSRLGAERELENALDARHLPWSLESEPLGQP